MTSIRMVPSSSRLDHPNLSSTAFFFGCGVILLLVGLIFSINTPTASPTIRFGSCNLTTETVRTHTEQTKGLSGRTNIASNFAMIFPFKQEQPYFWMRGMVTSIDIIWVDQHARVIKIDANLPADDGATTYQAPQPINWVIETRAGQARSCGVQVGTAIDSLQP